MTRFALTLAFFSLVLSTQLPAKAFQQTNPTRAKTIEESQRKANQKEQEKQKQAKAKANEKLTPEELGPAEVHQRSGAIDVLVEDDPMVCKMLARFLETRYRVLQAPKVLGVLYALMIPSHRDRTAELMEDLARLGDVTTLTGGRRLELVADQRVERGGCIVDVGPARVDALISAVEQGRTDLTDNYDDWIRLGLAIAAYFGPAGEDYYQRLSQFHPKYDHAETSKKYEDFCRNGRRIKIGTFFKILESRGYSL